MESPASALTLSTEAGFVHHDPSKSRRIALESPHSLGDSDPCGVKMKDEFSKCGIALEGARGSASQCCMQLLQ